MADERLELAAMGSDLEAARTTIEVLLERYESVQGLFETDSFALHKAMAALENNVEASTRALRASEARMRTLFDHGPHMLVTVDAAGCILTANRRVARALRLQASELEGQPLASILAEDSVRDLQRMLERRFEGVVERVVVLNNGMQVALTAAPMPGFAGETQLVLRDLTWRKLLEEELQHARRLALLGHLAAVVGHEINNPLAVMLGRVELILQSEMDDCDRLREQLGRVLEHGQRIGRIVQDLQAVARPQPARLERIKLVDLLDEVSELALPYLGRAVMWVDVTPPGLHVLADAEQLRQALLSLVSNAADRGRRTGRVVLKAERVEDSGMLADSEGVVISVLDEGPRVPPDLLDDLLAPPSRASTKRSGYALGLAIAQNVVIEHGGTMSASNRPEGGGVFSVVLPSGSPLPSVGWEPGSVPRIELSLLCVDDDPRLVSDLQSMLEGTGCSWHQVHSGEEALEALGDGGYDVLLTSMQLPGMSGVELQHVVAQRDPVLGRRTVLLGGALRSTPAGVPTLPRPFSRLQLLRCLEGVTQDR
jgi:PAS domain S-box-containing protein